MSDAGAHQWYREFADVFISPAGLPLCERPDIGNFTALVSPGIDRPELVRLAILDHCRIVRTLGEQKPRRRRGNCMVPKQFKLVENEQERIRVVGRIDAVELSGIARAAYERAGPRDALRSAGYGGNALFKPRLGPAYCSPFRLSRGRPRRHDRGHLGVIAARETDLGAEGASKAVANDNAGWARRRERPLPEHGNDRGINFVTDGGPPSHQQRYEHHWRGARPPSPMKPFKESTGWPTPSKVQPAAM